MAMRIGVAILVLCLTGVVPAWAGVVRTLDGKVVYGDIKGDGDNLLVSGGGSTTTVPIDQVLHADLTAELPLPESSAADARLERFNDIRQWTATDVGKTKHPGKTIFEGSRIILAGAGMDVAYREDTTRDDFYFYHRPLPADGQIVARVISFTQERRAARVGIIMRAGLDPQAPHAMLGLSGSRRCFQFRSKPRGTTQREERGGAEDDSWLKLVRRGSRITAFGSRDGREWKPLGSCDALPAGELQVGLAVASRQPERICTAVLADVSVTAGSSAGAGEVQESAPIVERGIMLRDGTLIPGEIRLADNSVVRFAQSGQKERGIPVTDVSRLLLRPVKTGVETRDPGAAGAILRSGDFVDGQVRAVRDGQVRINSVLFGLRSLQSGDVAQVIIRPSDASRSAYEVRLRDGATYLASALNASGNDLKLNTAVLGAVKAPWANVRDIRAAAARLVPLASMNVMEVKGAKGVEGAYLVDGVPGELEAKVGGEPPPRGSVGVRAGVRLVYELDAKQRGFSARVGVPEGVAGGSRLRFVVVGDGKELYKSEAMTAMDLPASVTVPLAGIKRLELRVLSEGKMRGVAAGVWMEGVLAPAK